MVRAAFLLRALLVAALLQLLQPTHSARVLMYVSPDGGDFPCGRRSDTPCKLGTAIRHATAHTTLLLSRGIYNGAHVISTPLTIQGETFVTSGDGSAAAGSGLVVLDGAGWHRPLTYDNVPAHLYGITFVNGVGEGAGCVSVSLLSNRVDEVNNITRCTFLNCTGVATEPTTEVAAGAVAVTYAQSHASSYELNRVVMSSNFARSKSTSAGGALVRYGAPTGVSAGKSCNTYVLQGQNEELQIIAGVYQKLRGVTYSGHPVYKSTRLGNPSVKNAPLQPFLIAFCAEKGVWSLFVAPPGLPISEVLESHRACTNPIIRTSERTAPEVYEAGLSAMKWMFGEQALSLVEPVRFVCQDLGKHCPIMEVVNAKDAQAHRNGLFYRTNITRGGRPSFKKVRDSEKQQWMWFCPGAKEWIISDDDPEHATDTQKVCSRGVTALDVLSVHPMYATHWRYWDLDTWRPSPSAPHGISLRCRPPISDMCSTVEVVNLHTTPSGPYLITNFTWNAKPTYKLALGNMFIWHCGVFSEWVISDTNPRALNPDDEACSRSLSSHPTQAFMPSLSTTRWAAYAGEEWKTLVAPLAIRCIEDCPRLVVSNVPRELSGIYTTLLRFNGSRVYYKHHPTAYIYLEPVSNTWHMASDIADATTTYATSLGGRGVHRGNIFSAIKWEHNVLPGVPKPSDTSPPLFACDIHKFCSRLEILSVPGTRFLQVAGTWVQQPYPLANRPVFKHATGRYFIFYCKAFGKWVMGPDVPDKEEHVNKCPAWFSTRITASPHPTKDTTWALVTDGQKWENLPTNLKVTCAADPDEPDTIVVPTSVYTSTTSNRRATIVTDSVTDCNFTGNIGLSQTTAGAAGAVGIYYGRTGISPDPIGAFRKLHALHNEAVTTHPTGRDVQGAGAVLIHNDYEHRTVYASLIDSVLTENRGEAGAVALDGVRSTLTRVQLVRNHAFGSGGGVNARYRSNVTVTGSTVRGNHAERVGGFALVSHSCFLTVTKSDVSNNTAHEQIGTTLLGGQIAVSESKMLGVTHSAMSACFMHLMSSELSCARGIASSFTTGFGCLAEVADAAPPGAASTLLPASPEAAPDPASSYFLYCVLGGIVAVGFAARWFLHKSPSLQSSLKKRR